MDPTGNAALGLANPAESVLPGDRILMVNEEPCFPGSFDSVMDLIIEADTPTVELTLGRPLDTVEVRFPDGAVAAGNAGMPLKMVAARAGHPVVSLCLLLQVHQFTT